MLLVAGAAMLAAALPACAAPRGALGPGDQVRITVFQNPDLTTEARVSEDGTIVFPLIGEVALGGRTPAEAGLRIAERLKEGKFLNNPQVGVSVMQVRSRQVSVLGQVGRPGRYALDDAGTKLTDVLALAGGITPAGDDTVTVMGERDGKPVRVDVDVAAMIRGGDASADFEVRNGDTLFVQRAPVFYIYGEVQRAGAYRFEPGMLVMQAISLGGGLTARGTERGLEIHRRMPDGTVRRLDARPTDPLEPDDVVYVSESLF
jgi:polysaccharide biosynthesis/export protein